MTEVEDDVRPRKVITFFHNLRGFDGNFLLKALYDQGRAVEKPLTQGAKILSFECGNLIFKDSLNFFAMPLECFPSTFNLTELQKGYFPHPLIGKRIGIMKVITHPCQNTTPTASTARKGARL